MTTLERPNLGCRTCASDVGVLLSSPAGLCDGHADELLERLAAAEAERDNTLVHLRITHERLAAAEAERDKWAEKAANAITATVKEDRRAAAAEADADQLAEDFRIAQGQWGSDPLWRKWELDGAIRLHDEAVTRRSQP